MESILSLNAIQGDKLTSRKGKST